MPAPYMAAYSATKFAVEGYSESVDLEVRDHNIRVLLVEPGATRTGFDDNTAKPDNALAAYERQRERSNQAVAEQVNNGDDPVVVAKVVVTAASASTPKMRYRACSARQLSAMSRFCLHRISVHQVRKYT